MRGLSYECDEIRLLIAGAENYLDAQSKCGSLVQLRTLKSRINSIRKYYFYSSYEEAFQHSKQFIQEIQVKEEAYKAEASKIDLHSDKCLSGNQPRRQKSKSMSAREKKIESWKQQPAGYGARCSPEQLAEYGRVAKLALEGINEEPKQIDAVNDERGLPKGFKFGSDEKKED